MIVYSHYDIMLNIRPFHKVSARWIPKQLPPVLKQQRVDACEELLQLYEAERDYFRARIVTGDES